jgi:hypothetical protein
MKYSGTIVFLFCLLVVSAAFGQKKGTARVKKVKKESRFMESPSIINLKELAAFELANPPKIVPINKEEDEEGKERIKKYPVPRSIIQQWLQQPGGAKMMNSNTPQPIINSPVAATTIQGLIDNGSTIPPDVGGTVGTNHLLTTLNSQIRVQSKTGTNLFTVSLDGFWNGTGGGNPNAFDPKALYDPYNDKYIITAPANPQGNSSSIMIAVTETNDPTGNWYRFIFDADASNNTWFDYPSIGFNNKWIVVTGNMFTNSGGFNTSKVFVFNKSDIYAGTGTLVNTFTASGFTIVPATTYDNSPTAPLYMIAVWNNNTSGQGVLRRYSLTGTTGSPVFNTGAYVNIPNPWSDYGPNAPQQATNNRIANNDDRMQACVYRNGALWCTHNAFYPLVAANHTGINWYQIDASTSAVTQYGALEDSSGATFYAFPSIAVNVNNDVLIGFSQFSGNMYASASYAFRKSTDPLNTLQVPYVYKMGENTYYKTYGGTTNRWGDYSSTYVDSNDTTLWTLQEYAETPANTWATYWAKVIPDNPGCSGQVVLNACPGLFEDGSGNNNYGNNSNCSWLIQPNNATSITLNFTQFQTQLTNDFVTVYDGSTTGAPILGTFSGSTIPPTLTSTGGSMLVVFTTNGSVTNTGWQASYTCAVSNPGGLLSCNGQSVLTPCTGNFTDGSGSNDYDNYVNCSWLIQPANATSITLDFTAFATESGYDFVTVYDGSTTAAPVLGVFDGNTLPPTLTSTGGSMLITFISDPSVTDAGWAVSYSCTQCVAPSQPVISAGGNTTFCQGGSVSLTGNVSGGCTGCTYSWSNGMTGQTISVNTAGSYTVTATKSCGASAISAPEVVTVNALPSATSNNSSPVCEGNSVNLTATGGGTYAWSGPNGFSSTLQNPVISNVTATNSGNYTVTVTGANGCTNTASTSVTVNALPSATSNSNSPVCVGNSVNLTATGGGTYAWSGPNGFSSTLQNPVISNVTATNSGNYTVTVTGANGCTNTASTSVTVNALPTATSNNSSPVCEGNSVNLTATGGGTYAWSGPNGFSSTLQNPVISNVTATNSGNYTVTVTGANGCTNTASTSVTVNALPSATSSNSSPVCEGNSVNLTATGGGTYAWSGPNGFSSTLQNPVITNVTAINSGNYTVTVTDANGCTNTASTSVTVNALPSATSSNSSPVCEGNSVNLTATGGGTYAWSGPNGFSSTLQNPVISNVTAINSGNYTVTVTDANGCTNTASTSVTVNALPSATSSNSSPVCEGNSVNLTATGGGTYAWSGPNGFSSTLQNPVISNVTATNSGNYTVTVTDANGCTNTASTSVTVNALPSATSSNSSPVCEGNSVNLTATGGGTYAWSGSNGFSSTIQNPVISNVTATNSGNYTVTVTGTNGCTNTASTSVTVNALPSATSSNSSPVCEGNSVNLTATGGGTYAWSGPNGFSSTLQNPVISNVTATNSGNYTVTVTSANGCSQSSTTNVSINAAPVVNAGPDISVSIGGSVQLNASGGSAYSWTPVSGLSNPLISNPIANPSITTVYTVWVTSSSDCIGSDSVTVFVWQTPITNAALLVPVKVFPNPTKDKLTVEAEGLTLGVYYLSLYNALGQLITAKTLKIQDGKLYEEIDMNPLAGGVYYLQLDSDNGFFQNKVIKE